MSLKLLVTSPINVAHLTQQSLNTMGAGVYSSIGDGRGNITFEIEASDQMILTMLQTGLNSAFEKVSHGIVSPPRVRFAKPA